MDNRLQMYKSKKELAREASAVNQSALEIKKLWAVINQMVRSILTLENKMKTFAPSARKADWRSLAMLRVLDENKTLTEAEVVAKAEAIEIEHFDYASQDHDLNLSLVDLNESALAEVGHFAITSIRVYKGDEELEHEKLVRCKFEIGKNEIFKELDTAIVGMKVGEFKEFPLNLQNETDHGVVELLALKKKSEPVA